LEGSTLAKVKYYFRESCPYCHEADALIRDLCKHYSEYQKILIERIEQKSEEDKPKDYHHHKVPAFYLGDQKLHEGEVTRDICEKILKKASKTNNQ